MRDQEYQAVRQRAGLIDCSTLGVLEVTGADRLAFLHNLLTNDLKRLTPGTGCDAALVTPVAKLVAYVLALVDEERMWLVTDRACVDAVLTTLHHYLITEDVAIHDRRTGYRVLALQGPAMRPLAQSLGTRLHHQLLEIEEAPVRHVSCSVTGEPGVLLLAPAEQASKVWETLQTQAQPVGLETWQVLRLEAGIPWDGIDMDHTTLFPETGLHASAVSDTKGCYVGQEVIARLATQGSLSRKLVGLRLEGAIVPQAGDAIQKDGEPLGAVTSACLSPTLHCPIALGYVKRPFYEVGTSVEVIRENRPLVATLVTLPFLVRQQ